MPAQVRPGKPKAIEAAERSLAAQLEAARSLREELARLADRWHELREEWRRLESLRIDLRESLAELTRARNMSTALRASHLARGALSGENSLDRDPGMQAAERVQAAATRAPARPDAKLSRPEQRVVDALAWLERMGLSPARDAAVASLAGYRVRSAGWMTVKRKLCRRELVLRIGGAQLRLTANGRARASVFAGSSSFAQLREALLARLDAAERRILHVLFKTPLDGLDVAALARRCGYDLYDATFEAAHIRLRALGLITSPAPGQMRVSDELRRDRALAAAVQAAAEPTNPCRPARTAESHPTVPASRPRLLAGGLRFAPIASLRRMS